MDRKSAARLGGLQKGINYRKQKHKALYSEPQVVCPACKGSGQAHYQRGLNDTPAIVEIRDCPDCNGTGCIPVPSTPAKKEHPRKQGRFSKLAQSGHAFDIYKQPESEPADEHLPNVGNMMAQQVTPMSHPDELLTDEEKKQIMLEYALGIVKSKPIKDWNYTELQDILIKAQLLKCHQSEAAEIASLQADIEELNILSRGNSEVYEARIKELEEQNEQLRIGELVIVTEQKQKEQIIAETKAPLMAKIKELEVKTGSCRGCDQFFSTQISEAKAEARREAQEVYMPKFTSEEILGHIEVLSKSFYDKYAGKGLTPSEVMELHKSEYWELVINFIEAPLRAEIAELKVDIEELNILAKTNNDAYSAKISELEAHFGQS